MAAIVCIENDNVANQIHGLTIDYGKFIPKLDRNTKLARAVDVMMTRAKRIYILIIKVNKFSFFSSWCFSKRNRRLFLLVSIEVKKHS